MSRKLIIDGNSVYEVDEDCMLRKRIEEEEKDADKEVKKNIYVEEYRKALRRTE